MSSEEVLRRLVTENQILEGTAENVQSPLNFINAAIAQLKMANETFEGTEEEKKDSKLFVPIKGGSYVKARLDNPDTVIVGIGAGVLVEKSVEEAKKHFERRVAELEKTDETLRQQLNQIVERIQSGRSRLQELSVKMKSTETQRTV